MGINTKSLLRAMVVEFVGLVFFVFNGSMQGASGGGTPFLVAACAHGITIALLIASMGHISGGHFNPAVTFGVLLSGNIAIVNAIAYVISQLLGGICGSLLARAVCSDALWQAIGGGFTYPNNTVTWAQGTLLEAILTFLLVNSVLCSAVDTDTNWLAPFAIGLTVFVDVLAGGSITGASMNPARSFGPAVVGQIWEVTAKNSFEMHYIYWAGPALGAAVAALLYKTIFGKEERRWLLT